MPRNLRIWLLLLVAACALGIWLERNKNPRELKPNVSREDPAAENSVSHELPGASPSRASSKNVETDLFSLTIGSPGRMRLADDAHAKHGSFWLEQAVLYCGSLQQLLHQAHEETLAELWCAYDKSSDSGVRVRIAGNGLWLEQVIGATGLTPEVHSLTHVKPALLPAAGKADDDELRIDTLGVLWRKGTLSIWWNDEQLAQWSGELNLKAPSARLFNGLDLQLGRSNTVDHAGIHFYDTFMREAVDNTWRPQSGKWELSALVFPERSANPFSLRCTFQNDLARQDPLYRNRVRNTQVGIGVELNSSKGTLQIERITGGGPAARAGLQEEDTIVEVNGLPVEHVSPWQVRRMFYDDWTGLPMQIKVLRAGEKTLREFKVDRGQFRWGTPLEGMAIPPVQLAAPEAWIFSGEQGWSDYAAAVSVKPLGAGGFGLGIGMRSPSEGLLLRWTGPPWQDETREVPVERREALELIWLTEGRQTVLATKPIRYRPYEFYRLELDWSGSRVAASLDGTKLYEVEVPGLKRGQIGLYALKGDAVFFDDVVIVADRAQLHQERQFRRAVNPFFAHESEMERWANPVLEWIRTEFSPWAIHSNRFPGRQHIALQKPRYEQLEVRLLTPRQLRDDAGVALKIDKGEAWLEDLSQSPPLKSDKVFVGTALERIEFEAGKGCAEARLNRHVLRLDLPEELEAKMLSDIAASNDSIAIRGLKNLGMPATVEVSASGVQEFSFDRAPTQWKVSSGKWGLLNKWICDPRWSWFGGRTETLGKIWNKDLFGPDLTVEAYVAVMMQREDPPYERAGDYNLTICGDGIHLSRGYTLIMGGDGNYWSRLYRNGKIVAETTRSEDLFTSDRVRRPDKPELHQRWFKLKLEKLGNRIKAYLDERCILEFLDPEPLGEGRVGFWTLANGVLLSRFRVAADSFRSAEPESNLAVEFDDGKATNRFDGEITTRVQPIRLPRTILTSLTNAPGNYLPAEALPETNTSETGDRPPARLGGYEVRNAIGGGPLALQFKSLRANLSIDAFVRFAIRVEPGTQVDFFLGDLQTREMYRWRMTGPETTDDRWPTVGEIPGIEADGNWRTVQINLRPSWAQYWAQRGYGTAPAPEMMPLFGCLDNQGYALAGMTANGLNTGYDVSELQFYRPEDVDYAPPKIVRVVWPYDRGGDGRTVQIHFQDDLSSIHPQSLRLRLDGRNLPGHEIQFDRLAQIASVDLLQVLGRSLEEGDRIGLNVEAFSDLAGNMGAPAQYSWTFYAREVAHPSAQPPAIHPLQDERGDMGNRPPVASYLASLRVNPIANSRQCSLIEDKDAPPWAEASRSIRVVSQEDGARFGMALRSVDYDLGRYPFLQLDYKIPFEVPVNLFLRSVDGNRYKVLLNDVGDMVPSEDFDPWLDQQGFLGKPRDFADDGTWRSIEIPLLRMLQGKRSYSNRIVALDFQDTGWRGNRKGMAYWIHRVRALPAGRSTNLRFEWTARDLAGMIDYHACIDPNSETVPQSKDIQSGDALEDAFRRRSGVDRPAGFLVPDGWNYLHVRTQNKTGAWSPVARYKFLVDNTPPRIDRTVPEDGGRLAGKSFKIYLNEAVAVRPETVTLSVNGRRFVNGQLGLAFDPEQQTIAFDGVNLGRALPWRDGEQIVVNLGGIMDVCGNAMPPTTVTFTADRSIDNAGPSIAQIRSRSAHENVPRTILHETSTALDFEESLGHVRALRDCRLDWVKDPRQAAFGQRCVRFVALQDDADLEILLHKNAWYIDRFPVLSFDYRVEGQLALDLYVLVLGQWYKIDFLNPELQIPDDGVPNVQYDGKWHHVNINLRDRIDRLQPNLPVRIVSSIVLASRGKPGTRQGAKFWLDNLELCPDRNAGAQIEWVPEEDPAGIEGYSVTIDGRPYTLAPMEISDIAPVRAIDLPPGTWFFHVRAQDQAGNWGPTRHFRIDY